MLIRLLTIKVKSSDHAKKRGGIEKPNEVLVEIVWENKEGAMQFMHDPSLKETMEKARVIGAPEFSFVG